MERETCKWDAFTRPETGARVCSGCAYDPAYCKCTPRFSPPFTIRRRNPKEIAVCIWCALTVYDDQRRIYRPNSNPSWVIHRSCAVDNLRYLEQQGVRGDL